MNLAADPSVEFVFPAKKAGNQARDYSKACLKVRDAANLKSESEDLHFVYHDLRHTAASLLAKAGLSLLQIGKVLGHTEQQTTQRYSHLIDEDVAHAYDILAENVICR